MVFLLLQVQRPQDLAEETIYDRNKRSAQEEV